MGEPTIRPYRPEDRETIAEMADVCWQRIHVSYRKFMGDELYDHLFSDAATRKGDEMRRFCDEHPEDLWVCELDGRAVGFVSFKLDVDKRIGEIGNNGVLPEFAGCGIGRHMYKAVLEHFRRVGMMYAKVRTGLDEGHAPARRAYEAVGFNVRQEMVTYFMKL